MELSEFLLARIAEDEAAVAEYVEKWGPLGGGWSSSSLLADDEYASMLIDPRRILAECEAKRRLLAWHAEQHVCEDSLRGGQKIHWDAATGTESWVEDPCDVLRLLALPYADHADYDATWRP